MDKPFAKTMILAVLIALAAGCGPSAASPTPVPPTAAPPRPTAVPTQKPAPPTDTPPLPTTTPAPPTATQAPTTEAPTPTPEAVATPPSVDDILAGLEGLPIDEFFEESARQLRLRDPDILFADGLADFYGVGLGAQFTDLSADYIGETQRLERETLDLLRTYDRSALPVDQQISYDVLAWYLDIQVRGHAFTDYKILVNPVWGLQNWPIDFLLEHPLESKQDAENYIARLSNVDTWMEQVIAGLERNERAGAIPPQYVIEDTIAQLDALLRVQGTTPADAKTLELYTNFRSKLYQIADLGEDEREILLSAVLTELEETFIPAYLALKVHLVDLTTLALEDPNQWELPGGEAYYNYLLAYYTGTDLSADELHALGLAEVARIQEELANAAAELGYPAELTMAELNQRMREESQPITGQALLQKYEQILAAADRAAADYFDLRTSADVVIRSEPIDIPAYYIQPAPGSSDPGVMPVNLSLSPLLVNYNEHVLVHHETIPGHHTQVALAQELDLPGYQRFYNVNPYLQNYQFLAYVEGWALYSEGLAWEMGLYDGEPFANLGRLRLQLFRAVRMVVDTGIHAKGWSLDEAAAYLEETTGIPQRYSSLTRYLVNPGYACSYNVSKLKLLDLRQRAMEQLGEGFDIKAFHNVVLGHGVVPLEIIEQLVDDWIVATLTAQTDSFPGDACVSAGLPAPACRGVSDNDAWTPVVREFNGISMVLVPAGCFNMGNESNLPKEQPVHRICFDRPFWIDRTETTVGQFAQFLNGQDEPVDSYDGWLDVIPNLVDGHLPIQLTLKDGVWKPLRERDNQPIENVTWTGAYDYCAGRGARLPTEAEWEYAARGPDSLLYPWGNEYISANLLPSSSRHVPDVGSIPRGASWVGALDMSGSLYEWTSSLYRPYPYDPNDGREASLEEDFGNRVFRGCPWYHSEDNLHGVRRDNVSATARHDNRPDIAFWYFGFRCTRSFNP